MTQLAAATVEAPVLKAAAGYVRESTEEQGQGFSPEMQRKAIERWAADHGYEIVEWYVDYISGREAEKRGDFKRLIDDARDGRFRAVIAFHTSRFARNAQEAQIYKNLLRKKLGIAVEFATQHFGDPSDPSAWLNERLNEVIDEHRASTSASGSATASRRRRIRATWSERSHTATAGLRPTTPRTPNQIPTKRRPSRRSSSAMPAAPKLTGRSQRRSTFAVCGAVATRPGPKTPCANCSSTPRTPATSHRSARSWRTA